MTESATVTTEIDGPVARVTLCRPQTRNAQTPRMWEELEAAGRSLPGNVRCVIVSGQGPAFSSGIDLSVLQGDLPAALMSVSEAEADARVASFQAAFDWLRRPDLVSIAAVSGHAIGAGLQLALACDLRVLADDARLRVGEPGLGLVPDLGGTKRLVDLMGYSRAIELCLTGRNVSATEAMTLGLATVTVDSAELADTVEDLALAVLSVPRDAAVETKALLLGADGNTDSAQLAAERAAQLRLLRARAAAEAGASPSVPDPHASGNGNVEPSTSTPASAAGDSESTSAPESRERSRSDGAADRPFTGSGE